MTSYMIFPHEEQEKFIKAFLDALEISFVKNDDDGWMLGKPVPLHSKNLKIGWRHPNGLFNYFIYSG